MDLELKTMIDNAQCAVVIRGTDGRTATASGHTIAPLVSLTEKHADLFPGAQVADRIIGKGAASLMAYMGVKEAYGYIMSESGLAMLQRYGISASWGELVDVIYNNAGTDMCPLEKTVLNIPAENLDACAAAVLEFARSIPEHLK